MGDSDDPPSGDSVPETVTKVSETGSKTTGGICQTKLLEERWVKGELKVIEKSISNDATEASKEYQGFALVSKDSFNHKNKFQKTTLKINSPHILKALREVAKYCPGYPLHFDDPTEVKSPFAMLYHHKEELKEYQTGSSDSTVKQHLSLLLEYLAKGPIADAEKLASRGYITFPLLWWIFRPGELLFTFENAQRRVYWLEKAAYDTHFRRGEYIALDCLYTANDGTKIGRAKERLTIFQQEECPGSDSLEIMSLSVFPLKYYPNIGAVKIELSERGKLYEKLQGVQVKRYEGLFMSLKTPPDTHFGIASDHAGMWLPNTATGRVVVDCKTFIEDNTSHKVPVSQWPTSDNKAEVPQDTLSLTPPYVYGYSLDMRCWCKFFIDNLSAIQWSPDALDRLFLPKDQIKIIRSLVSHHHFAPRAHEEAALKGKGLVTLLHGMPGTGKTLTVEAIAEQTKKPLLIIPTGELGSRLDTIQTEIKRLIRYATTWEAVVLIDEADVFLESRDSGTGISLEKNALVAVFLRQLEYFQGVIFLTSNRAQTFDPAVKSRIHLTLKYFAPNFQTRREMWRQKLLEVPKRNIGLDVDEALDVLARHEMNGREISNTVNSAKTLAKEELEKLTLEHLKVVVNLWEDSRILDSNLKNFDSDLGNQGQSGVLPRLVMLSRIRALAAVAVAVLIYYWYRVLLFDH